MIKFLRYCLRLWIKITQESLAVDEFTKLCSGIISYMRSGERGDINKKIEAISAINATDNNIDEAFTQKQNETTISRSEVVKEIVSEISSGNVVSDALFDRQSKPSELHGDSSEQLISKGLSLDTKSVKDGEKVSSYFELNEADIKDPFFGDIVSLDSSVSMIQRSTNEKEKPEKNLKDAMFIEEKNEGALKNKRITENRTERLESKDESKLSKSPTMTNEDSRILFLQDQIRDLTEN